MSVFRKTMVWLGLVDDDEYYGDDDAVLRDDEYDEPTRRRARRASGPRRARPLRPAAAETEPGDRDPQPPRPRRGRAAARAARRGRRAVKPIPMPATRVHVMDPTGFNDAQEVGDRLKAGQPVILNLQGVDRDLQRRLIDFSSGLAYALSGTMSKAADQVFLLTPSNVEVSDEEKERLQARGLYRAARLVKQVLCAADHGLYGHPVRSAPSCRGFRSGRRHAVATVYRMLLDLTEPVLAPLRRVIPPAGMFDLSFTRARHRVHGHPPRRGLFAKVRARRTIRQAVTRATRVCTAHRAPGLRVCPHGDHTTRAPRRRDPLRLPRLQPRRRERAARTRRRDDRRGQRAHAADERAAQHGAVREPGTRARPRTSSTARCCSRSAPPTKRSPRRTPKARADARRRRDRSRTACIADAEADARRRARPSAAASKRKSSTSPAAATRCSPTSRPHAFEADYRDRLSGVLENDLAMLRDRPSPARPRAADARRRAPRRVGSVRGRKSRPLTPTPTPTSTPMPTPAWPRRRVCSRRPSPRRRDLGGRRRRHRRRAVRRRRHRQRDGSRHRCAIAVGHRLLRHPRGDPRSRGRGRSRDPARST